MKSSIRSSKNRGDVFIPILVIGISIFGLIMVYSASYYSAEVNYKNKFFYFNKQLIGLVLGIISFIFFSKIDYKKLEKQKTLGFPSIFSYYLIAFIM